MLRFINVTKYDPVTLLRSKLRSQCFGMAGEGGGGFKSSSTESRNSRITKWRLFASGFVRVTLWRESEWSSLIYYGLMATSVAKYNMVL